MKTITRLTKFLQKPKNLITILVALLNQTAFAQDNGYWEGIGSRLRGDGVNSIAAKDSNIFISSYLSRWNGKIFVPFEGGTIYGLASEIIVVANDLYVGGSFTMVGSIPAKNIAKWDLVTKSWSALGANDNNGVDGTVRALAAYGRNLYVASELTGEGGISVTNIAKWNIATNVWVPLGKSINGKVYAIAACDGELYIGGRFTSAGDVPANNIAKWDDKTWIALGSGVNGTVRDIAILNRDVYVGGFFTKVGDVDANAITKWNIINRSWSTLSNGIKNGVYYSSGIGNVYTLAANDSVLFVGGTFDMAGDQNANNIAKWNPVNNTWSPLGSGLQGQAFGIATQNKEVYVVGGFTYAGGKRSDSFAIWHEPNNSPVITALPELRFDEDKSLLYPFRNWYTFVTDADDADSALTFDVLSGNHVKAARQATGYRFSAPANWFGKDTLQLIVKDPAQLADTTALLVTINPINDAPKISGLPDSLSFNKSASAPLNIWDFVEDVETPDSLLTYGFSASNPSLRQDFNRLSGMLKLTAPQFHGSAKLFVNVNDGKASARDTINVNVIYVNEPPVVSALPMLSFDEDKSLLHPIRNWYPFVADKDHADSTLAFAMVSGKKVSAARQDNNFIFSAPANWFGKDTLQLIVTDPGMIADTTSLMITVNSVNDAPMISGLPDSLVFKKGGSAQLKLWDYVEDVETSDRQLTYTFSTSHASLLRKFDHTTSTLVLTAPQFHGRAQIFINVSDGKAGAQDSVAVRVELPTGIASHEEQIPADFVLSQNYPNPFSARGTFGNPTTLIRFGLPHDAEARIEVLDVSGRRLATLLNERKPAGFHQVQFDARNLASGLYFYRLTAGHFTAMKKLMLVQ